jgi:hypothetical protein
MPIYRQPSATSKLGGRNAIYCARVATPSNGFAKTNGATGRAWLRRRLHIRGINHCRCIISSLSSVAIDASCCLERAVAPRARKLLSALPKKPSGLDSSQGLGVHDVACSAVRRRRDCLGCRTGGMLQFGVRYVQVVPAACSGSPVSVRAGRRERSNRTRPDLFDAVLARRAGHRAGSFIQYEWLCAADSSTRCPSGRRFLVQYPAAGPCPQSRCRGAPGSPAATAASQGGEA